jgi:two-component system nitrate/nitrite response regulator NarL
MNRVLLVLKSQLLRDAVRLLLTDSGFTVAGEAPDLDGALAGLSPEGPQIDFVVIDAVVCCDRPHVLGDIRQRVGAAKLIILTYEAEAERLGSDDIISADGILTFGITSQALVQSLRLIQMGERVVPRNLMQSLIGRGATGSAGGATEAAARFREPGHQLPSPREKEILRHLLSGHSNKMIARRLGITEATVKVHLKGLLRKIRAANRTQAAIWALNNGYSAQSPNLADR